MPVTGHKRSVVVTNRRVDLTVATGLRIDLFNKFDALARRRGITRATLLRELIENAVEENE